MKTVPEILWNAPWSFYFPFSFLKEKERSGDKKAKDIEYYCNWYNAVEIMRNEIITDTVTLHFNILKL